MKRKAVAMLVTLSLVVLLAFPAYAAQDLRLQVNGGSFDVAEMCIIDDYSMISVDKFAYLTGTDLTWLDGDNFVLNGNYRTLPFTVGAAVATDGVGTVDLPVAPVRLDGVVYIPLRAVSDAMGFTVDWDGASRLVSLNRDEVRDGMTALDLLIKSNEVQDGINNWGINGNFQIKVNAMLGEEALVEEGFDSTAAISGEIQIEPFLANIKQTVTGMGAPAPMVVETYIVENKIYTRVDGAEWLYMESPMLEELLNSSMGAMGDPMHMTAFMKDMHKMVVFGNDTVVDGNNYYVVNAFLNPEALASTIDEMVKQLAIGITELNEPEMEAALSLLQNMQMECRYTALINKDTFISDIINIDIKVVLPLNLSDLVGVGEIEDAALDGFAGQTIMMELYESGSLKMSDLGGVFNAPDVSGAVSIDDLRNAAGDGAADAADPDADATEDAETPANSAGSEDETPEA